MHRAVDYAYNREKGGERMKIAIVTGASSGLRFGVWPAGGSGWRRWRRSCAPRCGLWPWI